MAERTPNQQETRVVSGGEKRGLETDLVIAGAVGASQFTGGFLGAAGHDTWDKLKDALGGNGATAPPASGEEGDQ